MRIVIAGASGFLGTLLTAAFRERGDDVIALKRGETAPIDGSDVVINLAGRNVNCRYTARNRSEIMSSRVDSTRLVGRAVAAASHPPKVWLQMSTASIYPHQLDAASDEYGQTGCPEWPFSIEVARAWERAASEIRPYKTRVVKMRTGVVMAPVKGTPFRLLLKLAQLGLGGRAGDGRQYVSWIHYRDFVKAVMWLIDHEDIDGVVNLAAPNPLPNEDFMRALRREWGVGFGLPAPHWLLRIGAFLLRTEPELLLKSRRVVSRRLADRGFTFAFATWNEAARDLCSETRRTEDEKNLRAVRLPLRTLLPGTRVDDRAASAPRY